MEVEHPNAKPLSPADLQDLEKLKATLEQAIADGFVSADEMKAIKAHVRADGKITIEEVELCQKLIWDKIQSGEVEYDW